MRRAFAFLMIAFTLGLVLVSRPARAGWAENQDGQLTQAELDALTTFLTFDAAQLKILLARCTFTDNTTPIPYTCIAAGFQPLNSNLTDLADGSLTFSKVGGATASRCARFDTSGNLAAAGADCGGSAAISDTAFGSGWNDDTTTAPSKNAVYDELHLLDSDDDGKVNAIDQVAGLTNTDASGVVQAPITTSAGLRGVISDKTGTGAAVFAGGDIGAATATTPATNDDDTSVATTAYVNAEIGSKVAHPPDYCVPYTDGSAETYMQWAIDRYFWRPGRAITITGVWGKSGTPEVFNLQKCDPSCGTNMLSSDYTGNGTAYAGGFVTGENVIGATDYIWLTHVSGAASEQTEMVCVSFTVQ